MEKEKTIVTRNKDDIFYCFIKDNYSKEIADFVKQFHMFSEEIDLSHHVVQDMNGYYHYYPEGIDKLKCNGQDVSSFLDGLSINELAFLTYKLDGLGYILLMPYNFSKSPQEGWKEYVKGKLEFLPQLETAKKEIYDFRVYNFGENHNFVSLELDSECPLSSTYTSVLEQLQIEGNKD